MGVLVEPDGTAWTAPEWDTRLKERLRDYNSKRNFPLLMGVMLLGSRLPSGSSWPLGVAFATEPAP